MTRHRASQLGISTRHGLSSDIRDTKLSGFVLRCRKTGTHSYVVATPRGRWTTIGRVGEMTPEAARAAAAAILGAVSRDTLKHLSDDPTLSLRDARTRARGELKVHGARRLTWRRYLDEHYGPWVEANRKTDVETVRRLRVLFGDLDDTPLGDISAFSIECRRSARL